MRNIRHALLLTAAVAASTSAYVISYRGTLPAVKTVAARGREAAPAAEEFQAFLAKLDAAQQEFHNGRPDAVKALWSHADDVTLAGGSGGEIEKGWGNVSRRLDWAGSQYTNGVQTNERVTAKVSGELAYVVQLEHIRFHVPGQERESKRDYRITMVFRREAEGWRIIHRQADTQTTRLRAG